MTMNGVQQIIRTLVFVLALTQASLTQHSHHMKRQGGGGGSQTPQLHLEVASDKTFTNTYLHAATPEYHMSQSDNIAFNFTCNIKNPSHRYKLTMTKEQILSDGTRALPENLIDPDNIENVSPEIKKKFGARYSIDFVDVDSKTLRISLIIKGMKLEDNGLYACKYSNISKSIIAHVYKSPQMEDIKFGEEHKKPVEKLDLKVGTPSKLVCSVNDVYPKPKVTFHHSNGVQLNSKDISEKSQPIEKTRYHFSVTSTYSFMPSHADNNKNLYCNVVMGANKTTLTKQIKIHVTGAQLVDNDCREVQGVNPNSPTTHKVECTFFTNPKYTTVYFETLRDNVTDEEIQKYNKHQADVLAAVQAPAAAAAAATGFKPPQKGGINPNTVAPSTAAPPNIMVRITENQPTDNYALTIEPVDEAAGVFKAVLKINQLRDQDYKNYTFKTDKLTREIKLVKGLRDMALSGQDNHAASMQTPHSARILLLVFTSLLAALLVNWIL